MDAFPLLRAGWRWRGKGPLDKAREIQADNTKQRRKAFQKKPRMSGFFYAVLEPARFFVRRLRLSSVGHGYIL